MAHTKARFEKAFAWDLLRSEVAYFLPMVPRVIFSGGRKRHGMAPLFPGYVFFAGDDETRQQALRTDRLCHVIAAKDQQTLVNELASIQKALETKTALDPYPHAAVGKRVRIAAGPLEGIEGIVVQRDNGYRLVLQVSMLGQSVAMEVEAQSLELAE